MKLVCYKFFYVILVVFFSLSQVYGESGKDKKLITKIDHTFFSKVYLFLENGMKLDLFDVPVKTIEHFKMIRKGIIKENNIFDIFSGYSDKKRYEDKIQKINKAVRNILFESLAKFKIIINKEQFGELEYALMSEKK